jgi:polyhydroxybutyrate depolymerase
MSGRRRVLAAVLGLISLPVVLVVVEAGSYYVLNRNNGAIVSSGLKREYFLYVPDRYDRSRPTPLVISMHGGALWPAAQRRISGWNEVADRHGFIVVYPAGYEGPGPTGWEVSGPDQRKGVRFIADLIDTLQAEYNIDPSRIYADGLSIGGGMAFVLSCTLSDRIAAVGLVGAANMVPWSWCTDQRAVPMINFHGTADAFAPYEGGKSPVAPWIPFPGVPAWTANWARRNRCDASPVRAAVATDVTRIEYTNCADDAAVVLYTIVEGGHTWPGGRLQPEWTLGTTSHSIDASSTMWDFFREHPLPKK